MTILSTAASLTQLSTIDRFSTLAARKYGVPLEFMFPPAWIMLLGSLFVVLLWKQRFKER